MVVANIVSKMLDIKKHLLKISCWKCWKWTIFREAMNFKSSLTARLQFLYIPFLHNPTRTFRRSVHGRRGGERRWKIGVHPPGAPELAGFNFTCRHVRPSAVLPVCLSVTRCVANIPPYSRSPDMAAFGIPRRTAALFN